MRRAATALAVLATLVVGGCQRGIDLTFTTGPLNAPVVAVEPSGLFGQGEVCLRDILIAGADNAPVWHVRRSDLDCTPLKRINYGTAPKSFETVISAAPLQAGVVYTVEVHGPGWVGVQRATFSGGRWQAR